MSKNLSSTSIQVTWFAPLEANGEILEYAIGLQGPQGSNSTFTSETKFTLTHLTPYTPYNFSISAVNRRGMGPSLMLALHTDEAGEWEHFKGVLVHKYMYNWTFHTTIVLK